MRAFQASQARKDRFLIFWIEKNKFQTRKVKFQKGPNKKIFQRGYIVHGFCQKIELLTMRVFQANQGRNDCFFDILDRKEYFLEQKSELFKKCVKNRKFLKGVVHDSCPKLELLTMCAFFPNQGGKDCLLILWIEKNTFQTRKVKLQRRPKNRVFQRGQFVFLSKNQACYHVGFQADQGKKGRFLIFWIEKNTFQSRKVKFQKRPKNRIFQRGVIPWFLSKT